MQIEWHTLSQLSTSVEGFPSLMISDDLLPSQPTGLILTPTSTHKTSQCYPFQKKNVDKVLSLNSGDLG